jgi:hypothetical protein
MKWYMVTKTIHGRKYLYWQKTYRVGKSTKTLNRYICPADSARASFAHAINAPAYLPPEKGYDQEVYAYVKEWGEFEFSSKEDAARYARDLEYGEGGTWQAEETHDGYWRAHRQQSDFVRYHMGLMQRGATGPEILSPHSSIEDAKAFTPEVLTAQERREDERIQYGNLKSRIRREDQKRRAANRNSKGVKKLNPFLGQAIKHDHPTCYMCGKDTPSLNAAKLCAECADNEE